MSELLKFKIWIFQTSSDGEMAKMKVIDPTKLYNFVVDDIWIWICLEPETLN